MKFSISQKVLSLFAVLATVTAVGLSAVSEDAFAKRVGGGRNSGKQSEQVTQRQATPAQGNTASPQAAAPAAGAAGMAGAAAQAGRSKWLGPIAGLAAGLGLAALASHLGMGEAFGSIMMMVLFGMIAIFAIRFFMARRQAQNGGMRPAYAGAYSQTQVGAEASVPRTAPIQSNSTQYSAAPAALGAAGTGSMIGSALRSGSTPEPVVLPAGFDAVGFVRQAKMNYIRLQASFDAGNLNDLREFTSPEMFAELQLDIQDRKGAANVTEVLEIEGEMLGVHSNSVEHMASVRFQGSVREQVGAEAVRVDEVWNLTKPLDGSGGWVLAGIQQLS